MRFRATLLRSGIGEPPVEQPADGDSASGLRDRARTWRGRAGDAQLHLDVGHHRVRICNSSRRAFALALPLADYAKARDWYEKATAPWRSLAYFRLYGPLEPYLSRSWKLPDFEDVAQTTGAK